MVDVDGAGEMDEKPTRSLRLAPWRPETGLGAAKWVALVVVEAVVELGGCRPWREGLEEGCVVGVADWKSSKSSSSAPPVFSVLKPLSIPLPLVLLPFVGATNVGPLAMSSSPNEKRSTSGSFAFAFAFGFSVFSASLRELDGAE